MHEKLDSILKQLKELTNKLDKKKKKWVMTAIAAVLIVAIVGALVLNLNPKEVLFTGLNQQEVSEVVAKIQEMGIGASFDQEGNIKVPSDQLDFVRAQLAMDGYPRSGLSYNVFSKNVTVMSTEFEKEAYMRYDLQERIAATIRKFDGVKDATVTIVPGSDKKYALEKDKTEASASATLTMAGGSSLTDQQAAGIRRLVATSISGLKDENIAITDTSGRSYTAGISNETDSSAKLKMELENQLDSTIQQKVAYVLEPICGENNFRVSVRSTVDVTKKVQEILNYTPPAGGSMGIPSSDSKSTELSGAGQAGVGQPGTDTNAQVPEYPTNVDINGNDVYYKGESSADYLVDQLKEQVMSSGGELTDLTVSVVMDVPDLSNRQMTSIRQLVGNAAGILPAAIDEKVVVVNQRFVEQSADAAVNVFVMAISRHRVWIFGGIAILLLLLAVLLVLSRIGKRRRAEEERRAQEEMEAAAKKLEPEDIGVHLDEIKHTRETELKGQIRDFAEQNPEISAQLIKTWLKGGDRDGE